MTATLACAALCAYSGCVGVGSLELGGGDSGDPPGDAAPEDAGARDAEPALDTGHALDAGPADASSADGGGDEDSGPGVDAASALDAGPRDAGAAADASPRDAGPADAASPDAGVAADAGIDVPAGYELVWSDEFDVDGTPDPKSWTYERGFVRNHEDQWYQPENARVEAGLLVIEARRERIANPDYQAGSDDWKRSRAFAEYSSASLLTAGLRAWQYGRFEMRARIPTRSGMWPAWWTLGQGGEWPSNGEVDIMEYYRGSILANVACGTTTRWVAKWDSSTRAISAMSADWASRFHVWRMEWDTQSINLYVDGGLMNAVPLQSMVNPDGTSPFRQPHFMILSLAIGGDNGGDPSASPFPARYEVDYIRVFRRK